MDQRRRRMSSETSTTRRRSAVDGSPCTVRRWYPSCRSRTASLPGSKSPDTPSHSSASFRLDVQDQRFLSPVPERLEEDVERLVRDCGYGRIPVDHDLAAVVGRTRTRV